MCKRNLDLALVAGVLCIMLVFLFTAITYADCPTGDICVNHPTTGDVLVSGDAYTVELTIDPTAPRFATQYRLYVCCNLPCSNETWGKGIITLQMCDPNASRFSYKLGEPRSGCPEKYLWEVPFVQAEKTCKLAAVLLDANVNPLVTGGHVISKVVSEPFKIKPLGEPVSALDLTPPTATVLPGGPSGLDIGKANYEISGGVPPFTVYVYVGSSPPGPIIYNYVTINGKHSTQTFFGPTEFTVGNIVSAPCPDTTLTIAVRDSAFPASIKTASYVLDCP
jgi:hypothetical protein